MKWCAHCGATVPVFFGYHPQLGGVMIMSDRGTDYFCSNEHAILAVKNGLLSRTGYVSA